MLLTAGQFVGVGTCEPARQRHLIQQFEDALVRTRAAVDAQRLSDLGAYPPFLAAWGPFILFALIGEMILIRTEE